MIDTVSEVVEEESVRLREENRVLRGNISAREQRLLERLLALTDRTISDGHQLDHLYPLVVQLRREVEYWKRKFEEHRNAHREIRAYAKEHKIPQDHVISHILGRSCPTLNKGTDR